MVDIRKTRTCEKCDSVVILDKVRLVPKGNDRNWLVCDKCCDELKKISSNTLTLESKVKPLLAAKYLSYFCLRCDYKFRADTNKAGITYNLHCPYCGKADQLQKEKRL